ncbi:hypothetical protein RBY4I_2147 [Rhodobacterales bacterium Y4I]|nr:hypothetical protein RBY4I_2147 [Rhodobacterales bacterium Y4I]
MLRWFGGKRPPSKKLTADFIAKPAASTSSRLTVSETTDQKAGAEIAAVWDYVKGILDG